jgi:hypothetical protein
VSYTIRTGLAAVSEFERDHGAFSAAEMADADEWAAEAIQRASQTESAWYGCIIEALDGAQARSVGTLAGRAGTSDIVDACVVEGALRRGDLVVSSDEGDLQLIASAAGGRVEIDRP